MGRRGDDVVSTNQKAHMSFITKSKTAKFMTMTRPVVDGLLALNIRNRAVRPKVVADYRRIIQRGMWKPTNQGVAVTASGFLADGQHRLLALQAEGYPAVVMLVVTGLDDDVTAAIDNGTNRNARDYLQFMFDTKVSNTVGAILRASMMERDGRSVRKYTPYEYAARLDEIGSDIGAVLNVESTSKLPAAVLAALVDAHANGRHDEVIAFSTALATGAMLERDNPALVLRNWIAASRGNGGGEPMAEARYRKTTAALQAWIDGKKVTRLHGAKASRKPRSSKA